MPSSHVCFLRPLFFYGNRCLGYYLPPNPTINPDTAALCRLSYSLGAMATFIAIVAVVFLVSGLLTTLLLSRVMGARPNFSRVSTAFLASCVFAAGVATAALFALTRNLCGGQQPCEYAGFMEGGLVLLALWLVIYSVSYIALGALIARYQAKRIGVETQHGA